MASLLHDVMDVDLLHQAAAQAKTSWLEQALTTLLPQVEDLTTDAPGWQDTAAAWADQIDQLFEERRLLTPSQQKNRRTDIANALRTIDPQHPVIPFVLLPSEVYTQMNNEQASRLNARENKFFSAQQSDELVGRAIALLESDEPDEVAAGLAVLVGRRSSEILLSRFQLKTAYSLLFSEAVKRRGETGLVFEIPTLAPADRVLRAIAHLKRVWSIADLKALDLPDNHLKRRINARYSGVPRACRTHFADLVPGREAENDDGERLYTHLFRAVYAEIATYYYKPQWVPDHRFKAEIQGHFKLMEDGQRIPNYAARQNYDDYLIRDRAPGRPGVKLGEPGVEILEVFQKNRAIGGEREIARACQRLEAGTVNALLYRAVDRLLFSQQWVEGLTGLVLVTGRAIEALRQPIPQALSPFSIGVEGLEVPTLTGASQVIAAWRKWKQLEPLPRVQVQGAVREVGERTFGDLVEVRSLGELRALYSAIALHWFCPPGMEETAFLRTIGAAEAGGFETVNRDRGVKLEQHQVQLQLCTGLQEEGEMGQRTEAGQAISSQKQEEREGMEAIATQEAQQKHKSRHRRKTLSVDADLLRTVAAAFGIEIRGKGGKRGLSYEAALTQLLSQLAQERQGATALSASGPTEEGAIAVLKDQARTLAWLTGRVEGLEQQLEALRLERDEAISKLNSAEGSLELEQLQFENDRLRQERDEATGKLQAFRQLLNGTGRQEEGQRATVRAQQEQPISSPSTESISTTGSEPLKPARKRIPEEEALHHIRRAIRAIMQFNDQEGRPLHHKWYISFPVVQTLLRANGFSANQKTVSIAFDQLHRELEHHHDKHLLGSRHNRKHPNVKKIADVVHLEKNKE